MADDNYRTDLSFSTIKKALTRTTLNLADNFNAIFEQLFSNDARLKESIDNMKTNGVKANGGNADTLDGKGISYFAKDGHKHKKSDIEDFPAALPADGGNADTVAGKTPGIAAGNILVLDGQGKVPKENQYSNDKDFRLYWQVNETVAKDDIRFLHYGPTWAYLNCIQAGQTGSSEPDPSLIVEGEKITDGSVRWEVLQLGNPPKVGGILAKAFALLSGAIFTGIIKAVAPAADSNDDSVPTTSWVLAVLQKIFREHIVKDYSMEQNGYIQGGDWVGGLILQWGYQVVRGVNPVTYNLPISFTEQPFTVAISTVNSGNHAACNGFTKTTITLKAGTTADVFDAIGYVIIGQ